MESAFILAQTKLAQEAVRIFLGHNQNHIELLNISENVTFKIEDTRSSRKYALRLNRPGYNSKIQIQSELCWIKKIREDIEINTPSFKSNTLGESVLLLSDELTTGVLFDYIEGNKLDEKNLSDDFIQVGSLAARMHVYSKQNSSLKDFHRFTWSFENMVGPNGRWGNWEVDAINLSNIEKKHLKSVTDKIQENVRAYGVDSENFGLIHGDMRMTNIIKNDQGLHLIDFDDSGFCWYIYDLAASLSFIETDAQISSLINSWIAGYEKVSSLTAKDVAVIPSMIMLRRMLLLAWVGTHQSSPFAKEVALTFSKDTLDLGVRYLGGGLF